MRLEKIELYDDDDNLLTLDVYYELGEDYCEIIQIEDEEGDEWTNHTRIYAEAYEIILNNMQEEYREEEEYRASLEYEEEFFEKNGRLP